jgi:hypothetical protein
MDTKSSYYRDLEIISDDFIFDLKNIMIEPDVAMIVYPFRV